MDISNIISSLGPFINNPINSATSLSKNGAVNMQQIQQLAQQMFSQGSSASGLGGIPGISELFSGGQDISALTRNASNPLEIINSLLGGSFGSILKQIFDKDPIRGNVKTETFQKLEKDDKVDPPYYFPKKEDSGSGSGSGGSGGSGSGTISV